MINISLDLLQTTGLAAIIFILGRYIKSKVSIFQKYFIPAPVISGLLFSIIIFLCGHLGVLQLKMTTTLQDFFMNVFFCCTGFTCSIAVIKKSGKLGAILAVVAVALLFVQNLVGIALSELFGINKLLGIAMGSISMSGGVGSGASFGPTLEEFGAAGATTIGIASATFGLLLGSLAGGPVAARLIKKYQLKSSAETSNISTESSSTNTGILLNETRLFNAGLVILIACFLGAIISYLLKYTGLAFPYYVGCLFGGAIVRNLADMKLFSINMPEINIIGNSSLNIFLSLALMSLNISKLIFLAGPMVIILLAQTIVMMLWAYFITFRSMGKNYDAAVMAAGHCGVGLGQTPNAIANMSAIIERNGPAPTAWFVLPVITVIFINIMNPIIITFFINMVK